MLKLIVCGTEVTSSGQLFVIVLTFHFKTIEMYEVGKGLHDEIDLCLFNKVE